MIIYTQLKKKQVLLDSNIKIIMVFHSEHIWFLNGLAQDHSQTISSKSYSECIISVNPQKIELVFSQPVSQSSHQLT